jgi:hypothetical protein
MTYQNNALGDKGISKHFCQFENQADQGKRLCQGQRFFIEYYGEWLWNR